ncbi:MAG: FHA domain-containing protein [Proteobacteria bacterium]|nr:FHA domain-containing protein [Pseudomonadota bacterium]
MLGRDELIILSGSRRGEGVPLKEDRFVVGRETGDLVLDDTEVSSIHALFLRTGKQWAVQDLGSTNGVWVDGIAYDEVALRDGADIVIGTTRLVLRTSDVFRGEETTDPGSEIPQPEIDLSWVHALADPGHTFEYIPDTIYDDLTPTVELTRGRRRPRGRVRRAARQAPRRAAPQATRPGPAGPPRSRAGHPPPRRDRPAVRRLRAQRRARGALPPGRDLHRA